jgi:hypothetical protein
MISPSRSRARSMNRQREKPDDEHAQREQQPLPDLDAAPLAAAHFVQELEGGELHATRPPAVQEMDENRERDRGQRESEETVEERETHRQFNRPRFSR